MADKGIMEKLKEGVHGDALVNEGQKGHELTNKSKGDAEIIDVKGTDLQTDTKEVKPSEIRSNIKPEADDVVNQTKAPSSKDTVTTDADQSNARPGTPELSIPTISSPKKHSTPQNVFPISTSIKDYGYAPDNPLFEGIFPKPLLYEGENVFNVEEDLDEDYPYNPYISPVNVNVDELSSDEINRKARALFDFSPENDNEVALHAGQLIWISYRHGQGWLVAEDPETGENGLVPEEYVEIEGEAGESDEWEDYGEELEKLSIQ